jgi:hypothetical protein
MLTAKAKEEAQYYDRLPIGTEELLHHHHDSKTTAVEDVEDKIRQCISSSNL